mgnify:CR=1 FL=1
MDFQIEKRLVQEFYKSIEMSNPQNIPSVLKKYCSENMSSYDDFKIGAPEFWEHHSNNYKEDFDEDEDFTYNKRKGPKINVKKTYT